MKAKKQQTKRERLRDWKRVLKNTGDWDWAHVLEIWTYALTRLRDNVRDNNFHTTSLKHARQMTKAIELLTRVRGDYNWDMTVGVKSIKAADRRQQRDLDKALKIVSKNLFYWWD